DSITNEQLRITGDSITNEQLRITGEDDPCVIRNFETRNLPKVRFPEFEGDGEWVEKKLGEIAENLDSHRVPITSNIREKGKIPYYGASGIIDYVKDYIFDEHLLLISEDGANLIARVYPIAFSISGKTWINNHAHVLKFKNWFTQVLVEKYLNSKNIEDFLTGMAQPKLNRGKLDIIPIPLPNNSNEQQKIASCLSALDEIITAQTEKIEQLQQHKKGLMQGLFPNSIKNYESSITKKNRNS
ncbi:MAG: restriction endonuclease subunit S, partial [Lentimicrobium sp.]|nr:restriction endonuclease subunit S [Lentimicrobium sp.]